MDKSDPQRWRSYLNSLAIMHKDAIVTYQDMDPRMSEENKTQVVKLNLQTVTSTLLFYCI